MKYAIVSRYNENAMQLQSIGWVLGTKAENVKSGDFLMWNFGSVYVVNDVIKSTDKQIVISTSPKDKQSDVYEQKLLKSRLVCILKP